MKKRGLFIIIAGAVMIIIAMSTAYSVFPNMQAGTNGANLFVPENMFDNVTDKVQIAPGSASTFSHSTNVANVPLMWGAHITDYKPGDSVSITISNIFGDKFGAFTDNDPILVKSFTVPKIDTYNFNVENTGKDSVTIIMMFTENPEKSKALTDPNSPFVKNIIPLAMAGLLLIIGIVVMISGGILAVVDWKKSKDQSRYI